VQWGAAGRALFAEEAYRGISPVFEHDKSGRVLRVLRASLTNTPNLCGLTALHAEESNQGADMDLLVELRKLLGLPEDADAAAVIAKVKELNTGAAGAAAAQSQLKAIAKAANVAETAEHSVVLNAVTTLATAATKVGDERVTALQSELARITTSHNALQTQIATDRATAFVDKAIHAGRVGVKPLREHYITEHAKDPARVEKEINAMPIVEATLHPRGGSAAAHASDLDPVAIAAQATAYQKQQAAAGVTVDYASAVTHVTTKKEQAQ
jgi:phage I-like protein